MSARRFWTPEEEAVLRDRYATTHTDELARLFGRPRGQVHRKAKAMGLKKSREMLSAISREKTMVQGHGSHAHRFKPGLVPWNKGTNHCVGGRNAETRFKPGHKPHTWVPVGSYRIVQNKSGGPVLERKINDLPGPNSVRWHPVHRLVWEAAHGPVPEGFIVVFKPGMRTIEPAEITLDRLECITRTELMQRNSIHRLPPEFAEVARLKATLQRVINTRTRKDGQAAEPAETP